MKSHSSQEVIAALRADGWREDRVKGSHHHFVHPSKPGVVTVPHPRKTLGMGIARAIFKQAGIDPP